MDLAAFGMLRALDLAGTGDRDLHELTGVRVAVVGHPLGADDLEGFGHLGRCQLDDDALLAEVGEDLAADEEAVFAVLLLAGHIFPGAEAFDDRAEWVHKGRGL